MLVGVIASAGVYELVVVAPIKDEKQTYLTGSQALYGVLIEAEDTIETCQEIISDLADLQGGYSDAYHESRDAMDDFFDRYHFAAGNASYLYAQLYAQDDAISSAQSQYLASSLDSCYLD